MTTVERELYVCPAEDGVRCDHRSGWWPHACNFDDDHDGSHECVCGHTWNNNEEN